MRISFTVHSESENGDTVRYVGDSATPYSILVKEMILKASALPVPAPKVMEVTLDWQEPAKVPQAGLDAGKLVHGHLAGAVRQEAKPGVHVRIVKSRVSGVQSPPDWLAQYVGKIGVVMWTSPDGAMLEIEGVPAWFSYYELELLD